MYSAVLVNNCTNDNIDKGTVIEEICTLPINQSIRDEGYYEIINYLSDNMISSNTDYDSSLDAIISDTLPDLILLNSKGCKHVE